MLNAKRYAPLNARDKMPLEVTPVYYRLQRYDEAQLNAPAVPGAKPNAAAPPQAGDPPAGQADPTTTGGAQPPAAEGAQPAAPTQADGSQQPASGSPNPQ